MISPEYSCSINAQSLSGSLQKSLSLNKFELLSRAQRVKETYTQKPGFVRIVDVAPAQIDLSSLPAGLGFKFEFRTTQLKENKVQPIMDRVKLTFE